jgi:hypothetical protein
MSAIRTTSDRSTEDKVTERVALLWHQAEASVRSGRLVRARRFLRWILLICPDDEEAWLWLANLTKDQRERRSHLMQAYSLAPNSSRVQSALRQARAQQLESAVGELCPKPSMLRCLPGQRRVEPRNGCPGGNGQGSRSQPVDKLKHMLSRSRRILPTLAQHANSKPVAALED